MTDPNYTHIAMLLDRGTWAVPDQAPDGGNDG